MSAETSAAVDLFVLSCPHFRSMEIFRQRKFSQLDCLERELAVAEMVRRLIEDGNPVSLSFLAKYCKPYVDRQGALAHCRSYRQLRCLEALKAEGMIAEEAFQKLRGQIAAAVGSPPKA
jgi:hypothetical protein